MRLYKRKDGIWDVAFKNKAGKRILKSTGERNRAKAEQKAPKIIVAAETKVAESVDGIELETAMGLYMEHKERSIKPTSIQHKAKCFNSFLKFHSPELNLFDLGSEHMEQYAIWRQKQGVKLNTIYGECVVIRSMAKYHNHNLPIPKWTVGSYHPRDNLRYLSEEEYRKLLQAFSVHYPQYVEYVIAYVSTGVRASELYLIESSDLDFRAKTIFVRGTKTKTSKRLIPMSAEMEKILKGRISNSPIFKHWDFSDRNKIFAEMCEKAGIPKVTTKDLRKTFASFLINGGVSNRVVAQMLGHSDTAMVDAIYGGVSMGAQRAAIGSIPSAQPLSGPDNPQKMFNSSANIEVSGLLN